MQRRKRIALYGGTFDPVHVGHLSVARKLLELFALDEVLFIPAHLAPHKRSAAVTPPLHRYAMLALATQSEDALRISSIEMDAPERPYTFETLARLQAEADEAAQLFFVMGADSWAEITTWREWERVLTMTNHIIVARPGYELGTEHVTEAVRERIVDVRGVEPAEIARRVDALGGAKIYVTDAVYMNVSATEIRKSIGEGNQIWLSLVPEAVADYIEKYKLYRKDL
ncbi:MAG TPA: nicotinate-nucleotide adenylyltransferase [Pyrinomonadaceae bacterium]|jgi:nicotinate-nucleotide adenylyltransferase